MITIDFETRSEADLKTTGAWKYSLHESTTPLCMAWALEDSAVDLWVPGEAIPVSVRACALTGKTFEAHNAFFEYCIWVNIMVPQFGWPEIKDKFWRCSAAKCAAYALPQSLDKAGTALRLPMKKDDVGHRIMLKLTKPRKPTKKNPAVWHDGREDFEKLYAYCMDDVRAERCLSKAIPNLSPNEQQVWFLDQKINRRGIRFDIPAVKAALTICEKLKVENNERISKLTNGAVTTTGQIQKIKDWLSDVHNVEMASLDKEAIEDAFKPPPELPEPAKEILRLRQASSKTSTSKFAAILKAADNDGRVRGLFRYHGPFTGRWAARLVQPQNMPRNTFKGNREVFFDLLLQNDPETFEWCYPDTATALSQNIRGTIIPKDGWSFYGGDFSQIEPRMAMWLAGDAKALTQYHQGVDRYVELAKSIYQTDVITEERRQVGKTGDIGCVYGMGAERFQEACRVQGGVEITEEFSEHVIRTYRKKNWRVVNFWHDQEAAAMMAVQSKDLITTERHRIQWKMIGKHLMCRIPSGRKLVYPFATVKPTKTPWGQYKDAINYYTVDSLTKRWIEDSTHGGKILENIDQALSRDVLVRAMFYVEQKGYEIVLHAHDELLCEKEHGDVSELERLMSHPPPWAPDLPIKAKAWTGKRYLK